MIESLRNKKIHNDKEDCVGEKCSRKMQGAKNFRCAEGPKTFVYLL